MPINRWMDKNNVVYTYNEIFSLKGRKPATCYNREEACGRYTKWNKPNTKRQTVIPITWGTRVVVIVVPWTARRSNQSILKEISPEYSLEGLMLKLKLQYFGHLMWRADSLEKTLMLGKIEGRRRRGQQRMRWGITDATDMSLSKLQELVMVREA